jgi:hypothetical protein
VKVPGGRPVPGRSIIVPVQRQPQAHSRRGLGHGRRAIRQSDGHGGIEDRLGKFAGIVAVAHAHDRASTGLHRLTSPVRHDAERPHFPLPIDWPPCSQLAAMPPPSMGGAKGFPACFQGGNTHQQGSIGRNS